MKELPKAGWAVRITTSISTRNDLVGMRGAIRIPISLARAGKLSEAFSVTLGVRQECIPYTAELAAIAHGLGCLPEVKYRVIVILTSNKSAAQTIGNPRQQSSQGDLWCCRDAQSERKQSQLHRAFTQQRAQNSEGSQDISPSCNRAVCDARKRNGQSKDHDSRSDKGRSAK